MKESWELDSKKSGFANDEKIVVMSKIRSQVKKGFGLRRKAKEGCSDSDLRK